VGLLLYFESEIASLPCPAVGVSALEFLRWKRARIQTDIGARGFTSERGSDYARSGIGTSYVRPIHDRMAALLQSRPENIQPFPAGPLQAGGIRVLGGREGVRSASESEE